VSDERDSLGNRGNAAARRRGGAGAEVFIPDGQTLAGADRNNKNGTREIKGSSGPKEIGGRDGPDPTRFGDWEIKGRCIDF
jgi:hypothetical protein